jgi:hypothetical protein
VKGTAAADSVVRIYKRALDWMRFDVGRGEVVVVGLPRQQAV